MAEHFHEAPAILVVVFDPRALAITDAGLGRHSVVGGASIYPAVQNLLLAPKPVEEMVFGNRFGERLL